MSAAHREQIRQRLTELVGQKATLRLEYPLGPGFLSDLPCTILRPPSPHGYLPVRRRRERKTRWVSVHRIDEVEEGW